MKHRTVITPAAEPAQAEGRAAVPARVGMSAPSGLFAAMTAVAGLATGRRRSVSPRAGRSCCVTGRRC